MSRYAPPFSLFAAFLACLVPISSAADDQSGYGTRFSAPSYDVSHSGYPSEAGSPSSTTVEADTGDYVVIEVEQGGSEEVDGQTVIVVQEPEPVAASSVAPPPVSKSPSVDRPTFVCANGIWVEGHWSYANGDYLWVDGHCVVERVDYVFVHPRWDYYASVWWFVPGYFRPCGVWVRYGYHRPLYWFPPYYRPYYHGHRGVPVYRGAPHRRTAVRTAPRPAGRVPVSTGPGAHRTAYGRASTVSRSAPTRSGSVARAPTRTTPVGRAAPARSSTVVRNAPSRSAAVARATPTRTSTVIRATPTRAGTVVRATPTRTSTTARATPTRTSTVVRATPSRTMVNHARYGGRSRVSTVDRPSSASGRSSTVRRSSTASSRSGGFSRPSTNPSRTNTVRGPSFGGSRGGAFARPRVTPSRPGMGRSSGFGRPASGGFSGGRAAPVSRGR